jgi:hypothetical protein
VYIPGGAPKQWTTDGGEPPGRAEPVPAAAEPPEEVRQARIAVREFLAAAAMRIRLSAQGR